MKPPRTLRPARALPGACACLLLALSGCGQKGPLYLPDHRPEAVPVPAAPGTPADTPATRKAPRTPDPAAAR
jgi:predicted small lipoprotein YifL